MKIIISALSGIGDALMFSPSLKILRENLPDAGIEVMCMFKAVKEIYENNFDVDDVIYYDFINAGIRKSTAFVRTLRGKYDVSFNVYPSNRREYNIISFLLGARKRFAVRYLNKDRQNLGFLNNYTITEELQKHNVEQNAALVYKFLGKENTGPIPPLQLKINADALRHAEEWGKSNLTDGSKLIAGFHAGSATFKNMVNKRWSPEKFAALGNRLIKENNASVLLFGGPDEFELNDHINKMMGDKAKVIKTASVMDSLAIMQLCNIFVSNDSGVMHLASALNLKIAAIFGPTNTYHTRPWMTEYEIIKTDLNCQPCFYYSPRPLVCIRNDVKYKCLVEIEVDKVYEAVKKLIIK